MPIPDRESIKSGLIAYIRDHGGVDASLTPIEIYDGLADRFSLTPEDRALERSTEAFWENEVRWARQALVEDGYILPVNESKRGVWKLTDPTRPYKADGTGVRIYPAPTFKESDEFKIIHNDLEDEGVFSPASVSDAREIVIRAIVQRRGQDNFRFALIAAYNGKCCITGESCIQVLEAAHIVPYRGADTNHTQNGLLLRSDIHALFDLGLLAIDPDGFKVVVSTTVESIHYRNLHGFQISLPVDPTDHPSREALAERLSNCK